MVRVEKGFHGKGLTARSIQAHAEVVVEFIQRLVLFFLGMRVPAVRVADGCWAVDMSATVIMRILASGSCRGRCSHFTCPGHGLWDSLRRQPGLRV